LIIRSGGTGGKLSRDASDWTVSDLEVPVVALWTLLCDLWSFEFLVEVVDDLEGNGSPPGALFSVDDNDDGKAFEFVSESLRW